MLRLQTTLIGLLISLFTISAQTTVSLPNAGSLASKISKKDKKSITSIKINGPLNVEDLMELRELAQGDSGRLATIDLSATTLTAIPDEAFSECKTLTKVVLPASLTRIGHSAFGGCKNLTSINIPEKVNSIGDYAFAECEKMETFTIPQGVTIISNGCFADCQNLKTIKLPKRAQSIGKEAFARCTELKAIEIPAEVASIGGAAFAGCVNLSFIKVDPTNKRFCSTAGGVLYSKDGKIVLQYPAGKTGDVYTIPNGVVRVGMYAFSGCKNIKKITIPTSCTSVGYGAFYSCSNLEDIELPDRINIIQEDVFYGCGNLTKINIPKGVTKIGVNAFFGCAKLKSLTLPSNVKTISKQAFQGCSNLESINIPEGVTELPEACLALCFRLRDISLPSTLTTIGDMAFAGDTTLMSLKLPASLQSIGGAAFTNCSSLEDLKLPANLKTIGFAAFASCSSLKSLTIPASVDSVGISSIATCEGLTELKVEGTKPPRANMLASYAISDTLQLTVPSGSEDAYHNALGWKEFKHINGKTYEIVREETESELAEKMAAVENASMEQCFMVYSSISQEINISRNKENSIIYKANEVDEKAHFANGDAALANFLKENVTYPKHAKGKQGTVTICFVVEKSGAISNLKVTQSQGNELDAEAVATLFSMPRWTPAKKDGQDVRSENEIKINIRK